MTLGPLVTEIVVAFCLATTLLYRYGNIFVHHPIVTLSVLVAWYFSLLTIFVLPFDVSSTVFRQCVEENVHDVSSIRPGGNASTIGPPTHTCKEPWSSVSEEVYPKLWKIVYWTSQCLTWLILPLMQSYIEAGDFSLKGKLKSALIDNAIYYGSYLFICIVLLIYLALKIGLDLDGQKLKAIASSASNTWGLFLLVLLLGYALVEVPRGLWNASQPGYTLQYSYFKAAKLSMDKSEAEENVDGVLESLQAANLSIGASHPFREYLETIFQKIPIELKDKMTQRPLPEDTSSVVPSEKSLIRLHRKTIKSLQTLQRTETQWLLLVDNIMGLEDVSKNQNSHERKYKPSFPVQRSRLMHSLHSPTLEWYWKCVIKRYVQKIGAILTGALSVAVVWSEVTFFNKEPVLSVFARFVNYAKENYDYVSIELLSGLVIAYFCYCTYSTVLKIRVLNLYYLASHHQTNEYSLIFSGMLLCRLTPPMCLNFLGLIHMDSHIIKTHILETHYTQVMGHMDVISIISDGFNVYFPMAILAFCLATYFSLGSRLLSAIGFQQFLEENEITTEIIDEGRELIKRERRKRQRVENAINRRREFQERFPNIETTRSRASRQSPDTVRPPKQDDVNESVRAGLLKDFDTAEYFADSFGITDELDRGFQSDFLDFTTDNLDTYTTTNGLQDNMFDDV